MSEVLGQGVHRPISPCADSEFLERLTILLPPEKTSHDESCTTRSQLSPGSTGSAATVATSLMITVEDRSQILLPVTVAVLCSNLQKAEGRRGAEVRATKAPYGDRDERL